MNNLVFICGFPSSGTDLLKNIINAHSDISINGEFPFLPKMVNSYPSQISAAKIAQVIAEFKRLDVYHNFDNPNFNVTQLEKKTEYSLSEIYASMLTDKQTIWKGNKQCFPMQNLF